MRIPPMYVIKRLGFLVAVMWTAATINFILPQLSPKDPVAEQVTQKIATMGEDSTAAQEMIDELKRIYGLDKPLWQQYVQYIWNTFRFELGRSIYQYPRPVMDIIAQTIWWTVGFAGMATILAFLIGTVLGAMVGWSKAPGFFGYFIPPLAMFSAVPGFIIALVLIYFLAFKAQQWTNGTFYFPLRGGYANDTIIDVTSFEFWKDVAWHSVLPALSMLLVTTGSWALGMRAMMITVEGADYITFAEAKGLKGTRIFFRYALRNCMLPQTTALAMQLGAIVSGATLVENMFSYPGIGSRLGLAIAQFDYYVMYGIIFFLVVGIAVATFIVDLTYPLLDPRISYQET
ncbi:MAG: ABC transporter permease [Anaerolineae bacterium]